MIRLMIVEDQAMLRDSLACTINTQSDMEVVASLGDAAEPWRPLNARRDMRAARCVHRKRLERYCRGAQDQGSASRSEGRDYDGHARNHVR